MNAEEINYTLFMKAAELESKAPEELTPDEKVNLELNPYFVGGLPTTSRKQENN